VKIRRDGRFVLGGILGLPHTFPASSSGSAWASDCSLAAPLSGPRHAPQACGLLRQGRQRSASPFHDFRLSRGVTWLEPTLSVEVTYGDLVDDRLRDPVTAASHERVAVSSTTHAIEQWAESAAITAAA
jgi:hypothetical protein